MADTGAGYQSMTPNRASRIAMSKDPPFAMQVLVNNKACAEDAACKKNPTIKE